MSSPSERNRAARERYEAAVAELEAARAERDALLLEQVPPDAETIPASLTHELGIDSMAALALVRRARRRAGSDVPMLGIQTSQ